MKVHRRVRIPSPLLSSLINRITLNSRKNVMEMRAFSSGFCRGEESWVNASTGAERKKNHKAPGCALATRPEGGTYLLMLQNTYLLPADHCDQDSKTKAFCKKNKNPCICTVYNAGQTCSITRHLRHELFLKHEEEVEGRDMLDSK